LVIADLEGNLFHWNPAALAMHGFDSLDECRRKLIEFSDIFELSTEQEGVLPLEQWPLSRILRDESLNGWEVHVRRRDSDWHRVFSYGGTLARDKEGQPLLAVVSISDITERKRAEMALKDSEERFRTLADAIPQLCWTADAEGWIFWYNQRWYEYTGTTPQQMEGWGWQSVHDPEVLPRVMERWQASIATGKPFEMVFPLRGSDGVLRPFLTRVMPLCDPDGKVVRWFGTNTDIAERERAASALRQSEERYRSLFNSMLEGFCLIEVLFDSDNRPVDYRFLEINQAFEGQTGLRNAQGKLMRELAPEHEAHWFEIYGRVAVTGEPTHFVNEAKMLNRWYDVNAYRVGGQDSRKVAILFNDISDTKRAEIALRESKERLQLFIEHAPAALAMFDREMRYLSVSRRWLDDYHLGERDLAGISHYEIFPEVTEEWKEYHRRGLSGEVLRGESDRFKRTDGSEQWLKWEIRPWYDGDGAVGGIVIFAEDITKQHKAEEALSSLNEELEIRIAQRTEELEESRNQLEEQAEELTQSLNSLEEEMAERQLSEERLRLLIDGAKDYAIVMLEADGCVASWNEGATRLKGWSEQEILGRHFSVLYPEESVVAGLPEHELELAAVRGRLAEEGWRVRKDGSRFLADVIITAIRDDSGKLRGFSKITRDITERKRAEEQIQTTLTELERSNKELEQFAYVASHDLQEPLRMVSSYTQLLAQRYEGQLDDDAKKFIDYAVDGAVRMQRLINDLLAYSRVSTQGKTFATIDSHVALGEALVSLSAAIEENRALVVNDDLPAVSADAAQLSQLFQNLISNAIKFRGADSPLVRISASNLGREWRFSVRDNGIGIEKQYGEKVFEIFQRLHTRKEYPGTGIGLAICKRIVERHGGRIWFESEPGIGTTFYFTMPK
jgi:PAS domain S-box-containing protein